MNNDQVAERLRRFGQSRFGSMKGLADAIDMSSQSLSSSYLSGRSLPGPMILERLFRHGCSADWLLFGVGMPPAPTVDELNVQIEYMDKLTDSYREYRKAVEEAEKHFGPAIHVVAWVTFVEQWRNTLARYWGEIDEKSNKKERS